MLELAVELVNLRVRLRGAARAPAAPPEVEPSAGRPARPALTEVVDCDTPVPVYRRSMLALGADVEGPALVLDEVATTWLAPGWRARRDRVGNLLLQHG
jgi:N-methylhydantoinase A